MNSLYDDVINLALGVLCFGGDREAPERAG